MTKTKMTLIFDIDPRIASGVEDKDAATKEIKQQMNEGPDMMDMLLTVPFTCEVEAVG